MNFRLPLSPFRLSLAALLLTLGDASAEAVRTRVWSFLGVDPTAAARTPQSLAWYQAESLQLDEQFVATGLTLQLTNASVSAVWEVAATTNTATVYVIATGTVVGAASNHVRWTVAPSNSNLAAGSYRGYLRALEQDGTNLVNVGVLARQNITVLASPDSRNYDVVGPLNHPLSEYITNAYHSGISASGWVARVGQQLAISFPSGAVETDPAWNAEKSLYATGKPLYVYSETDPQWLADQASYYTAAQADARYATGDLWGAVAAGVTNGYLFGGTLTGSVSRAGRQLRMTLYAPAVGSESDPVWTSASNLYHRNSSASGVSVTAHTARVYELYSPNYPNAENGIMLDDLILSADNSYSVLWQQRELWGRDGARELSWTNGLRIYRNLYGNGAGLTNLNAETLDGTHLSALLSLSSFQSSQAMTNTVRRAPTSGKTNVLVLVDGTGTITTQRVLSVTEE